MIFQEHSKNNFNILIVHLFQHLYYYQSFSCYFCVKTKWFRIFSFINWLIFEITTIDFLMCLNNYYYILLNYTFSSIHQYLLHHPLVYNLFHLCKHVIRKWSTIFAYLFYLFFFQLHLLYSSNCYISFNKYIRIAITT